MEKTNPKKPTEPPKIANIIISKGKDPDTTFRSFLQVVITNLDPSTSCSDLAVKVEFSDEAFGIIKAKGIRPGKLGYQNAIVYYNMGDVTLPSHGEMLIISTTLFVGKKRYTELGGVAYIVTNVSEPNP